ncbi:MAG TPA: glycosyltransferase family 39 protein [Bacteroidia bacterium]|nr:glycosyltransferase family 39 protein [Bacteroidia bacterium]
MNRNRYIFPLLLILFWVAMVIIVNPIANFPLNDDWQYSRPVWFLINKGYYFATDTYSPILMMQVLWGALFCLPGGFSFIALRFSTLFLSLSGILLFYFLLLKVSKNEKLSFLGALLLAANPIFIGSSNSFMTDVPFLTFALLSIYFFFCAIESDRTLHIILATAFAVIATLIRQHGVVIPFAFAAAAIVKKRPGFIQCIKYAIPALITLAALNFGLWWLKHIGSELKPYEGSSVIAFLKQPVDVYHHVRDWGCLILIYSGFFILPLLVFTTWNAITNSTRRQKIILFILVLFFVFVSIVADYNLPLGNTLDTYGFGPRTLKGMLEMIQPNPDFSPMLLKIIKMAAQFAAIIMVVNLGKVVIDLIEAYKKRNFTKAHFKQLFILFFFIAYSFLIFVPSFIFDRYMLPFIAMSVIIVIAGIGETIKIRQPVYLTCCFITLAMGLFGSALTHDYISWNRARYQATDYLTKDLKISLLKMDGGYEFNGWYVDKVFPPHPKDPLRSFWFVDDDEYMVTFHNLEGYEIIKQFPYPNYVPHTERYIYVLHRKQSP